MFKITKTESTGTGPNPSPIPVRYTEPNAILVTCLLIFLLCVWQVDTFANISDPIR